MNIKGQSRRAKIDAIKESIRAKRSKLQENDEVAEVTPGISDDAAQLETAVVDVIESQVADVVASKTEEFSDDVTEITLILSNDGSDLEVPTTDVEDTVKDEAGIEAEVTVEDEDESFNESVDLSKFKNCNTIKFVISGKAKNEFIQANKRKARLEAIKARKARSAKFEALRAKREEAEKRQAKLEAFNARKIRLASKKARFESIKEPSRRAKLTASRISTR